MAFRDQLLAKIKNLSDTIWEGRARETEVEAWLSNFTAPVHGTPQECTLHALYLLSQFMYFGSRQMRELLRVIFRDLYKYPIIEGIRKANGDTTDETVIEHGFREALEHTLFLGVGNPSESGSHLLYYFRQENGLPKTQFIHSHQVFRRQRLSRLQILRAVLFGGRDRYAGTVSLRHPDISRYVFIDDFCGSGHQGEAYSQDIVEDIKSFSPGTLVSYFVLFGTTKGMEHVRKNTAFDVVRCVFELDETFKCFSANSRYFPGPSADIQADFAERMCREFGTRIRPTAPLGYDSGQLLIGFNHNTPDNTLPIFWCDEPGGVPWTPIFKRYPKLYG